MNILVNYTVYLALTIGVASPFNDNYTAIGDASMVQALDHYVIYIPLGTTLPRKILSLFSLTNEETETQRD